MKLKSSKVIALLQMVNFSCNDGGAKNLGTGLWKAAYAGKWKKCSDAMLLHRQGGMDAVRRAAPLLGHPYIFKKRCADHSNHQLCGRRLDILYIYKGDRCLHES